MNSIFIISSESGMLLFSHILQLPDSTIVYPSSKVIEMDPFQLASSFFAIYKLSSSQSVQSKKECCNEGIGKGISWIRQVWRTFILYILKLKIHEGFQFIIIRVDQLFS